MNHARKKTLLITTAAIAATGGIASCAVCNMFIGDKFEPTTKSLGENYQIPEWYKNAKFGIFCHWGPQCQPENGDWYARGMYESGNWQQRAHWEKYGDPKTFGFKDVIQEWHADKWDPDYLVSLYKKMGARYMVSIANHHDNFDLWDSKYQPWNSVKIGPKRDISREWKNAAEKYGLHWGVSIHASHSCEWYEPARSYDGLLTLKDGEGTWWGKLGLDPQDLYAQNHEASKNNREWEWQKGVVTPPTKEYLEKFMNRHKQLINDYRPEMIYFDDTYLPFYPVANEGLELTAYYYNSMLKYNNGKQNVVVTGKILNEEQRKGIVWDVERGVPSSIITPHWQTDTCIGTWHYDRSTYNRNGYKSAKTVIEMLVDIVSKGGNFMLSIPIRGNGTIDEKELAICNDIADWMAINSDGIYDTQVWKKFGEGPKAEESIGLNAQGFNEGQGKAFTEKDIRFTAKNGAVYAFVMKVPKAGSSIEIKSFNGMNVKKVTLLGGKSTVDWKFADGVLSIQAPAEKFEIALCYKVEF